jgi:hypothetical protein
VNERRLQEIPGPQYTIAPKKKAGSRLNAGALRKARHWRLVGIVKGCCMDGGFMLVMIGAGLAG